MYLGRAGGLMLIITTLALVGLETAAFAHHPGASGVGAIPKGGVFGGSGSNYLATRLQAPGQEFPTDAEAVARAAANPGPCTGAARDAMPDGAPHDHQQIAQHSALSCAVTQSDFQPLKEEMTKAFGREDVVLGEMDVKADIAAVAVSFPTAGIIFFDVKDPSKPKLLSIYRGGECDAQPIDIDCGAFVDLAADGKVAYLSVQNLSSVPDLSLANGRPGTSGVELISLADPKRPQLVQIYSPAAGVTGTHAARSHVIPPAPASGPNGPRAPGEYLFSNQNTFGVNIGKVERLPNGIPQVRFINLIEAPDLHDVFIQDDPLTGRTYLYLADGYGEDGDGSAGTAFVMYDVTDPNAPKRLGQWDLTPECERDWYSHTIDVTTVGGRRYVTLPAELFLSGSQSAADTAAGCGKKRGPGTAAADRPPQGSGNVPGPMWIVDATDPSKLAQAGDTEAQVKSKSQAALVTTWTNAAGRAGGNLTFSPHNQQIVGNRILLSDYHGGVYMLDATKAFDGVKESLDAERPKELGFVVPSGQPQRKNIGLATNPLIPFFTSFPLGHPEIWDTFFYRGCTLAADMTGGFYSYEFDGDPCTAASGGPLPTPPPAQSLGPIADRPPKARNRFVIRRRTRRVDRSGVVRVRVLCKSPDSCSGVLRLRTTGTRKRGGQLRLGKRAFVLASRANRLLTVRVSRSHLRVLGRQRTTAVRALVRVTFKGGEARRVVYTFPLTTSRGVQRRAR